MATPAQLVLCAIQAGVRLYAAGHKAYVETTLDRPLILPLPSGPSINAASAQNFFTNDPQRQLIAQRDENACIRSLLAAAVADGTQEVKHRLTALVSVIGLPSVFNQCAN